MTPDLDCTSEGGLLGDAANSSTSYNPMSPDEDDAGVGAHGVDVVDDDSDCCAKSGCSLEDTLSLTCDESLSSSNMEESSDNELAVVYSSPDILRRRLLPLAPSPIETVYAASPLVRGRQESRWQWRLRPSFRVLWLTMSMILYLFATLVDFRWMVESVGEVGLSKEAQQWNRFFRRKGPKIMEKIHSKSTSPEYTIRIKGSRLDLISQSLDFHHQCLSVKSVQVEWTDSSRPLPKSILNHKSGKVEMMQKPKTTALLLLDEDVILSCDEIERGASLTVPSLDIYLLITDTGLHGSHPFFFSFYYLPFTAFREWRKDPSRLVGFYPYHHLDAKQQQESSSLRSKPDYRFRPVSRGEGAYSILADRAVFVHNLYLRSLPSDPHNCQQLGLSIVVSSITSKPPIAVMSNPQTIQQAKKRIKMSEDDSRKCQQWIQSTRAIQLLDQTATIVGH